MATRSNIHFKNSDYLAANVYVHYDGYPDNRLPELQRFFDAVKRQCPDSRFSDGSYLAAKFIVWYSQEQSSNAQCGMLNFLGIGPAVQDSGDIDYRYTIDCDKRDTNGFPVVSYEKVTYSV